MAYYPPEPSPAYTNRPRRGRGSYSSYDSSHPDDFQRLPPDREITEGLYETAKRTLTKPTISSGPSDVALKPENLKYVASYNWVDKSQPTIIVPGSPPEWLDRKFPFRIWYDRGARMVDQNGFRMGPSASSLLPLFRAADVMASEIANNSIEWSDVDVVTDRNNLRKLLRWIQHPDNASDSAVASSRAGSSAGLPGLDPLKDFRIDVQLGGKKTLLFHRWEKRTQELAEPPRSGCGINFERGSTAPAAGCEHGTGHHRVIQYDFGGLKFVVRCEVDACLPRTSSPDTKPAVSNPATAASHETQNSDLDSLVDKLSGLNFSTTSTPGDARTTQRSTDIAVIHAGSIVPQSDLVELTTRSARYISEFDWTEQYPQLLLTWVPNLFLCAHERGVFERKIHHQLGKEGPMGTLDKSVRIQQGFRKLVAVLKVIQELVRQHGRRARLSLVCRDGRLEVFERTGSHGSLEDEELERFGM